MTQRKRERKRLAAAMVSYLGGASGLRSPSPAPKTQRWVSAAALSASLAALTATSAFADNELASLGAKGFDASLIDTACLTNNCEGAAKRCLDNGDCRKGMTCTAKCLGDNECITGCFAKYGNDDMNQLLSCSVDANGCIKIAILPPGPDSPSEAPAPPIKPLENFDPDSLEGTWYKVLGYNSLYDCFDQQKNTFTKLSDGKSFSVDVRLSMPRPLSLFQNDNSDFDKQRQKAEYPLRLSETLVFDDENTDKSSFAFKREGQDYAKLTRVDSSSEGKHRHASSVGHLFGLTFWENWSVVAESKSNDWKFVYYTGKTTQNLYTGAFVYSRTPTLSPEAVDEVFDVAKKAGWEPTNFCAIDNDGVDFDENQETSTINDKLIRQKPQQLSSLQKGLFVGAATAAEDRFFDDDFLEESSPETFKPQKTNKLVKSIENFITDVVDYFEDPRATAKWVFQQQRSVKNIMDRQNQQLFLNN